MFSFLGKKRAKKEAQIQAIKTDISDRNDRASASLKKVKRVLDEDITLKIYLATGGDRRQRHGR